MIACRNSSCSRKNSNKQNNERNVAVVDVVIVVVALTTHSHSHTYEVDDHIYSCKSRGTRTAITNRTIGS